MTRNPRLAGLAGATSLLVFAAAANAINPAMLVNRVADAPLKPNPLFGSDSTPTTVVVMLAGDSVAAVQRSVGRDLSAGERLSIDAQRRAEHAGKYDEIHRRGGTVLASFTGALNGIKVRIPRNQIAALRAMAGVTDVKPVGLYQKVNTVSVPYIGAPQVWQLPQQYQGQGVKIAIVDTGIDYTHANFGGPGTVAAFTTAKAASTTAANPAYFGPNAPKVKGGIDLVGDAYAPGAGGDAENTHPDPNPLDCDGHGSHVAGTAAGFGVTSSGATFNGPYGTSAYTPGAFKIGPGVAPKADLYAVRVFGCNGSTNVVTDAINWAVANGMNVISMSLGSDYGPPDNADRVAIANATAAGILVVAASGNAGPTPYITSSPASSDGAISVAAMDSTASFPGASLTLSGTGTILVQDSNGAPFANNMSYGVVVLRNANGSVSLGCNASEYDKAQNGGIDIAGKLVVALRGTCDRVVRAQYAQQYGAAAALLINVGAGYPPSEGVIPGVTIPFFGALSADQSKFTGAGQVAVAVNSPIANPTFQTVASFSSGGPRFGDSAFRPAVSAPGVAIVSTGVGTGTGTVTESGTSMATPHVAGVAALVKQANPTWPVADLRAAVVQSASSSKLVDYSPRLEGSGVVQPLSAVGTQAVVRVANDSASFGYADLLTDYSGQQQMVIHNAAPKAVQFNLTATRAVGPSSATLTVPSSVIVNANSDATFPVSLSVPAASLGGTHDASGNTLFQEVGGTIKLTPSNSRLNGNVSLTLPYYFVGHSRSNLTTSASSVTGLPGGNVTVTNPGGALAGTPEFYSTGLARSNPSATPVKYAEIRAVGVQSFPSGTAGNNFLVFAINTFERFSNAAGQLYWEIYLDTNNDGNVDYVLQIANGKYFSSAAAVQEKPTVAVINLATNQVVALYLADAATDNSTILVPVETKYLGLTTSNPRFGYIAYGYNIADGTSGQIPGTGFYNAFTPALSFPDGVAIPPNSSATTKVTINQAELARSAPLGMMIVAPDNVSGAPQARLVPLQGLVP